MKQKLFLLSICLLFVVGCGSPSQSVDTHEESDGAGETAAPDTQQADATDRDLVADLLSDASFDDLGLDGSIENDLAAVDLSGDEDGVADEVQPPSDTDTDPGPPDSSIEDANDSIQDSDDGSSDLPSGDAETSDGELDALSDVVQIVDTTIVKLQNDELAEQTCVRVSAVVMSTMFSDKDDTLNIDGGSVPRPSFYISEKGLGTTAPRSGIKVALAPDFVNKPSISPGDDVEVVGIFREHYGLSTILMTTECGSATVKQKVPMPIPVTLTVAQLGQSGGSNGCPPSGAPWVDGSSAEDYEGVLVNVQDGRLNLLENAFGTFEIIDDGSNKLLIQTEPFNLQLAPVLLDTPVISVTGFGHFSFCRRSLRPRTADETRLDPCGSSPLADHLLITEIMIRPNGAEFVELYNPTDSEIDLSTYYLYNATDSGLGRFYYKITSGEHFGGNTTQKISQFALKFPSGAKIPAGAYRVVALAGATAYCAHHFPATTCTKPDFELPPTGGDDATVPNMEGQWGDPGLGGYLGTSDDLVLFTWDGNAATVKDVDYIVWGSSETYRTNKSQVAGYLSDTPVGQQSPLAGSPGTDSYQRLCLNERSEKKTGGNGITGHDETSEDLEWSWTVAVPTPGSPVKTP